MSCDQSCPSLCSSHGQCDSGTCLCEVGLTGVGFRWSAMVLDSVIPPEVVTAFLDTVVRIVHRHALRAVLLEPPFSKFAVGMVCARNLQENAFVLLDTVARLVTRCALAQLEQRHAADTGLALQLMEPVTVTLDGSKTIAQLNVRGQQMERVAMALVFAH